MVNVMLIDDHPVVRAGLRAILNTFADVRVVMEGDNGADVDKLFADDAPEVDVVVCDIQMPGVDGITATKRVVEAGGPPVLILTTYDTQAERTGITRLLKDLADAGIRFRDLSTSQSSLEDIFVSLVKERR